MTLAKQTALYHYVVEMASAIHLLERTLTHAAQTAKLQKEGEESHQRAMKTGIVQNGTHVFQTELKLENALI